MRTEEEIWKKYDAYNAEPTIIELLMDIRELLIANRKSEDDK